MLVSVCYIILGRRYAPQLKQAAKSAAASQTDVTVVIEEGISSSREVIAFHREDWESRRFKDKLSVHFANLMKQVDISNRQALFSMMMLWGIRLVVLAYGGVLAIQGDLSIGWLVVIFQLSTQLLQAYEKVFSFFMGLAGSMSAVERVREMTEGEKISEGTIPLLEPISNLSFKQVDFRYDTDGLPVIRGLDIDIPIGKKVAFVGTSGGGKSTIAQLLIRFYDPDQGEISVNGRPLSTLRREDWIKRVTIVFQEAYLFPDSIRHNLTMGRKVSEERMKAICDSMDIHAFIDSLAEGYDTQVGERGIQLSGGQRQRIALARALLSDSEILILDEATSALDLETERRVQSQLDLLRQGATTIIIAHRLSTIKNADVIYVMNGGLVEEKGTHEQLLDQNNIYARLVLEKSS